MSPIAKMSYLKYRQVSLPGRTNKLSSKRDCPTEFDEARTFADYLYTMKLTGKIVEYAHLVNELSLNRKGGQSTNFAYLNKRKAEGWRKGVPDYLIILPAEEDGPQALDSFEPLPGKIVFVELKRSKGGSVSPEQKAWIEAINAAGGYARVAKGAAQAIEFIEGLL